MPKPITPDVPRILLDAGIGGAPKVEALKGGRNNRVYRVQAGSSTYLLKHYFQHGKDLRDRLNHEYAFSTFAWNSGVRSLPRPIACDTAQAAALFEFVPGRPLVSKDIDAARVSEAVAFLADVNRQRGAIEARTLPMASEAAFRVTEQMNIIDRRVERLCGIDGTGEVAENVKSFVAAELAPAWRDLRDRIAKGASKNEINLNHELTVGEQLLSPSDFGFHNAVLAEDGRLRFLDFEYAGWDDPAKTVCDFFCQPEVPVADTHRPAFEDAVANMVSNPEALRRRIDLLFPAFQFKWCCILLNDFLPVENVRRQFADGSPQVGNRDAAKQLEKARHVLAMTSPYEDRRALERTPTNG